ncbi:MAG: formimidoylglutamase, partial [Bacteroidota bacterium]|nr:formimidoylglutamase [Candidatus Kapabacteria bacterium]MDW8219886.1 formimidoylglutamase [Bacteroidota bacterium]
SSWDSAPEIAILGVPSDEGVQRNKGRIGARTAPTEIRRALYRLTPYSLRSEPARSLETLRILDCGDIMLGATLEETHERLTEVIAFLVSHQVIPIVLGGGHDISYPNFCGYAQTLSHAGLINIDTHLDFRPAVPYHHSGSSFRLILDTLQSSIAPRNMVEFGIQPFANVQAHYIEMQQRGAIIMTLPNIRKHGIAVSMLQALRYAGNSTQGIMVSIDMDAVRSSDAPGVSAPSPTGFMAEELLEAVFLASKDSRVGLIDIVEVNPQYDIDGRTAKLAALVVMYILQGFVERSA